MDQCQDIRVAIDAAAAVDRSGWSGAARSAEVVELLAAQERLQALVIAVVGDWDPGALDPSVRVVRNPEATEGMASSIRRGIAALPGSAPAVLLLVIDQPAVEVSLLRRLLQLHIAQKEAVPVACAYGDSLGIPAILPARFFPELLTLEGDRGAKPILLRENALTIPFPEGAWDLDTPEDLRFTR